MSHFVTLVIIPGDTPQNRIEQTVEDLLEPYSEHNSVEPYEDECGCIGFQALLDVKAEIDKAFNIDEMRQQLNALPEQEQTEERWKQMVAPMEKKRQELIIAHPLVDKPNPECTDCNGTGKFTSRYNPFAKWDWWVIGGRWSEWVFGPERQKAAQKKEGGTIFGADADTLKNNCRLLSEIPLVDPHYIPFAILTPDGEWTEQGEMGWWDTVNNGKDFKHWHKTATSLLEQYPEYLAVAVDCHI